MRRALADCLPGLRRYLFGLCGDWDQAEDMTQEALLRAWQRRDSFDGGSHPATWVFAIARNHWLDQLRRKRVRPQVDPVMDMETLSEPSPSPPAAAARNELAEAVRAAMAALPPDQRDALALRESGELSFAQIADLSGVPVATVKSRVRYALLKLADELARRGFCLGPGPEAEA